MVKTMVIRNSRELGEAVRQTRLRLNLRQIDLARRASVRQALVSALENGVAGAKLSTVIKILAALDLDLSIVAREKAAFDPTEY